MGGAVDADPIRGGAFVGDGALADFVVEDDSSASDAIEASVLKAGDGVAQGEIFGGGEGDNFCRGEAVELDLGEALLDAAEERLEVVEGDGLAGDGWEVQAGDAQGYGLAGAGVGGFEVGVGAGKDAVDGVGDDAFGVEGAAEGVGFHADADEVVGGEAVEGLLAGDSHSEILRLGAGGAACGSGFDGVGIEAGGGAVEGVVDRADEGRRVVKAGGAGELHTEVGGLLFEVDVDVVEDFYVIAEEAYGLEDDGFVAGCSEGGEGVGNGGADPGGAGDALGLEGEVPVGVGEADWAQGGGDGHGSLLAFDGVRVGSLDGAVVLDAISGDGGARTGGGAGWVADVAGHDGSAGDGMGGEEDGDLGAGDGAGFGPGWPHALGEG